MNCCDKTHDWTSCCERMESLESKLAQQAEQIKRLEAVRKWAIECRFDAYKNELEGACMFCDANLHKNCVGEHKQLDGGVCPAAELCKAIEACVDTKPEGQGEGV